jgi:hypothetical protein
LKCLGLVRIQFGREELCRPSDVDRLFGDLMLNLPALEAVRLVRSALTFWRRALSFWRRSLPRRGFGKLDLDECDMDREGFSNHVSMAGHRNCPLYVERKGAS